MIYVMDFLSKKEMLELIDHKAYKVINYLLKKVAFSQPESLTINKKNNDIQITKEFLEQWIVQGCDLEPIGSGNYPIDAFKINDYGVDVKFVSAKVDKQGNLISSQTNETSLGQNFKGFGKTLDQAFENQEYEKILVGWQKILLEKLKQPLLDFNLKKIFYFIFIRAGNNIHLSIAKINQEAINTLTIKKSSSTSVFVNNYIDSALGNVKIYKSKKRMELRLYAKELQDNNFLITWGFNNLYPATIKLRDIVDNDQIEYHIEKELNKFFNK